MELLKSENLSFEQFKQIRKKMDDMITENENKIKDLILGMQYNHIVWHEKRDDLNSRIKIFEDEGLGKSEAVEQLRKEKAAIRRDWIQFNTEMNEQRMFLIRQNTAIVAVFDAHDINWLLHFAKVHNIA